MKISSIAILVNPFAGKGKSVKLAIWLEKQLLYKQIACTIYNKQWPSSFQGFSDIWIIGGDGTINYFINHYPDCPLPLALFKAGTGNDFAWKLYGDISNKAVFEKLLYAEAKPVDAAKCNETLFINCLGLGFDGEIVRSMNTIRFLGGHLGYLLCVILKIFSFREKRFLITTANEKWHERFLLVMINNSTRAGGGFNITPTAEINDGKLNMLLCKKLSIYQRLKYLPILQKGRHLHLPFVIHRLGEKFSIKTDSKTSIQLDGELMAAKEINVEVLPQKFLFRY